MGSSRRSLLPLCAAVFLCRAAVAHAAPPPVPAATAPKPSSPKPPAPAKPVAHATTTAKPTTSVKSTRVQDASVRRQVAGGPTLDDASVGADTPELRALHAAERELFPPASPMLGSPWPQELPFPVAAANDRPRVHASGLSPAPPNSIPPPSDGVRDLAWLAKLDLPDLPVRWDARVVKYLEFFKDDPRGRASLSTWLRRSGRYRDAMRKTFRKKGLPEDLIWLSMIESGFDPTARSPVGAVGLWQFMPETGKIYGLSQDRWADMRMSLGAASEAAADHLADLHRRFGSWDLAMAAYNMGYGGVISAVRRYNTNDYWALAKLEGSFPWETTLYVPKILAAAIVSRNLAAFGFQDVAVESALEGEEIPVAPGTALAAVATACGVTSKELEQRNPELRASRTPPTQEDWRVSVPAGKASNCTQNLAKVRKDQPVLERYVVRFGESLEQIAQAKRVPMAKLVELNGIAPGEPVRGGMTLLVPRSEGDKSAPDPKKSADKPVVVVPQDVFVYPDRRRVFYRVQVGDTVREVCSAFKVTPDELRRWNEIDPSARLVEGMSLQIFAPNDAELGRAFVLGEGEVRTVVAGTDDFFHNWDEKGRKRIVVVAKTGDTLESIGKKNGVSTSLMERINRRGRTEVLTEGDRVVVWVPGPDTSPATHASNGPLRSLGVLEPTPPLVAPAPDALPPLR